MTTLLIQHVHTLWSKQSRGGRGARLRNSVPTAVTLPEECNSRTGWILHVAQFAESNHFERADRCVFADDFAQLRIQDLEVHTNDETAVVRFHRDGDNAVRTSPLPFSDLPAIGRNQWIRLRYNGRYVDRCTGNWWYEQSCYNLGWFETFAEDVFLKSRPTNKFEEIATLR